MLYIDRMNRFRLFLDPVIETKQKWDNIEDFTAGINGFRALLHPEKTEKRFIFTFILLTWNKLITPRFKLATDGFSSFGNRILSIFPIFHNA